MELKSLFCPNCGASLDVEDGIDTFFCKYCGYKIMLQGQSKAAYEAKVRVKHMEHKERLQDKKNAQERYRMESARKEQKWGLIVGLGILVAVMVLCFVITTVGNAGAKKQEQELQAIVDEIMIDIENEDFAAAYIKANSLYWDDSWTSEGEDKWDATRNEIIKQIEEAEKAATGSSSHESTEDEDDGGFFDWFS